ncbi:MAG: endonuclease [Planctomycetota bacterium]|nr:endonuclease [Planctomycetota bacterium]
MTCFRRALSLLFLSLLVSSALAEETLPGFTTVRTFPAPEAHQGVAASRQHVFAVTNRTVALYDRRTGKRLGLSTGEAMHLNSGFVWKGRVLCAHSNYPLQPEKSEVKVFDPVTLELATLINFGDYGGSLTWIVRRRGHWLCNFARYDENNSETFLVEFDAGFNELRRWTYPQSVIGKLGKYSLSGGVWSRGELLVTGHDDPVAFRVRIPRQGTELEQVGSYAVPFTGQGFAVDPVGSGLVGISRARHEVIFAGQTSRKPGSGESPPQ